MSKIKKHNKETLNNEREKIIIKRELEIEKKTQIIKKVLDNVHGILMLFKPILEKMIKMEETQKFAKNGTYNKAASLFGKIAEDCYKIGAILSPDNSLIDLKN